MNVLEGYLVRGFDVAQLVEQGVPETEVRVALRNGGVSLSEDEVLDCVSAAVHRLGYDSFAAFMRENQLSSLRDQARLLGVSRHALAKLHDAYRKFVTAEHSSG